MSVEQDVLNKIKFVLDNNNEAQAIRILEDYGFDKLEEGKLLSNENENESACFDYEEGINMDCRRCGQPKYKHK